ncbi:GNAT family N-acetyltransferase [Nonomuraea rhodomycinica]|uniref:GNAT family N-acetyltransferase n=1 Tax=Nonomuraea rhodomycinica TaxID=1712872 RepID=A0A7Y6IRP9_9ACTN|nr:GNAT family N-acetyltransferase [Nonomuraea rhodomycinica]NUW42653.1 GNAT family N-acetyltransferase [Nonomuraea rhodomycinica]
MWTFTTDVAEYAAAAEPFLLADPVRNTVPLTVLANIRDGMPAQGAVFGWWTSWGEVCGAAFRTPPRALVLADIPVEAAAALAEEYDGEIPGLVGPRAAVDAACAALGRSGDVRAERLYRLGTLKPPGTPGRGRVATGGDLPLMVAWLDAFGAEVGMDLGDTVEAATRRLTRRELVVWETDGVPVSMAGVSPAMGGVCRTGPVYTPPACRGRGHGSAVTAYASRLALDERGEEVVLFTDLANPTSNAIYQAIGYEPVGDYAHVTLAGSS